MRAQIRGDIDYFTNTRLLQRAHNFFCDCLCGPQHRVCRKVNIALGGLGTNIALRSRETEIQMETETRPRKDLKEEKRGDFGQGMGPVCITAGNLLSRTEMAETSG